MALPVPPQDDALRSCDLCEETIDEPEDGSLHRWHAADGSTIDLCSECLQKSFELLWGRKEQSSTAMSLFCGECGREAGENPEHWEEGGHVFVLGEGKA